jgi:hypothetical protein
VVADAGIPEGTIEFHAAAQVNWHTVVQQAHTRRQVAALVNVATRDYPGRAAELHTALAAYHAMLGASLQPSPPASPAFQVPYRRNPQFVGREAALTLLGELLVGEGSKAAVVAIAGMGGLGKTQLAAEFAHRRRQAFAGGVFWLNMAEAGEGDPIETQVTAKLLTEQSLATRLQLLGEEHPDTATSLNDLATLHARRGDDTRATPLYKRALAIRERVLGPDHPSTVRVRDNLNKVQREQHRADTHGD